MHGTNRTIFVVTGLIALAIVAASLSARQQAPPPPFAEDSELQTLLGQSEAEVRQTLGEPDFRSPVRDDVQVWSYHHESGKPFFVKVTANGTVVEILALGD